MNHYLITALPPLPELGGAPPLTGAELLEHVAEAPRAREAVALLLLGGDLRLRDAWLAGERGHGAPAVLSPAQVRGEAPLPDELLLDAADRSPRDAVDATWAAYFRHAGARAEGLRSPFLAAWLRHEVGLRAALARARAQVFNLEPTSPAPELADEPLRFAGVIAEWSQAPNQLAALRVLDAARLAWIAANEPWFSFDDDELVAWAARLSLLIRWHHLGGVADAARRPQAAVPTQGAPA